jgi:ClpP class serine protease
MNIQTLTKKGKAKDKDKNKGKNKDIATIQIRKNTRERLGKLGSMNETYDDFIKRILDHWEQSHGKGESA